jgi:hypothetical protein
VKADQHPVLPTRVGGMTTWALLILINENTGGAAFIRPPTDLLIIPPVKLVLKQLSIARGGHLNRRLPKSALQCQFFI